MTTVAVLGTGKMGAAIARRLHDSGLDLVLWNRTPQRAAALALGRVTATPAEAVREADLAISSLTDAAAVRDVYTGQGGAIVGAGPKLLIDMSTAGPQSAQELAARTTSRGSRFVAAPVIGSVPSVASGSLLILTSGPAADVEAARPVLERLGEVRNLGSQIDAGPRMKLVANSMLGIVNAAAAELLAAGTAAGLGREDIFAILTRFAGVLKAREAGYLHDQHEPANFAVRDLEKDLDLAVTMYSQAQLQTPLTLEARELFGDVNASWPELDISAITRRYRVPASAQALP